jgi:hypothetical protein
MADKGIAPKSKHSQTMTAWMGKQCRVKIEFHRDMKEVSKLKSVRGLITAL